MLKNPVMTIAPRKISAKALITDIRAGLDNPILMRKYSLSEQQLKVAFEKLIERGAINRSELDRRPGEPFAGEALKAREAAADRKEPGGSKPVRKAAGCLIVVDRYIKSMIRILCNTDQPMLSYIWRAWLIAFIPSVVIGVIAASVIAILGYKDPLPEMSLTFFLVVGVLIGPWVETVFMGWILGILSLITGRTIYVCLVSAVIWGILHGLQSIVQGLTATWGFFVLSLSFMEWWKKSKNRAICVAALIHTCQNSFIFALMLIFAFLGADSPQVKNIPLSPPARTTEVSPGREGQEFHKTDVILPPAPAQQMDNK
jgi:flagellar biosynthesis protein FliQ